MRVKPHPPHKYPWFVRLIFWAQERKYGSTLLPAFLWGRSPRVFLGLQLLYRGLDRASSPLPPSLRSLLNVRVSQLNHCEFCVDVSEQLLLRQGISLEKISALEQHHLSPLFSESERAALRYAEAMTKTSHQVQNDLFKALEAHFSADEIIELTSVIAYQNMTSKFNAALGVPAQGFCLPKPPRS